MAAEQEITPLEQLERAVAAVPPDVDAARLAIGAVAGTLQALSTEECVLTVQRTADLTARMATAIRGQGETEANETVAKDFDAHTKTYASIAKLLGVNQPVQEAPTQTKAKTQQTGGKR
jgi:hypothetical protein